MPDPCVNKSKVRNQVLSPEEQAEFLSAIDTVEQAVLRHLNANRTLPQAIDFINNLQRGVDEMVQVEFAIGSPFDCKAGCSHCCHVRVEALEPEIFLIVRELKRRPDAKQEEIILRLQDYVKKNKDTSILDHHTSCPFLDNNLCSIYSVRPAVCRKAHSYNVVKCSEGRADIPQSLALVLKAEALMQGTAAAYRKVALAASGHELGYAVLLALTDDNLESRWAAGVSIFDGGEP